MANTTKKTTTETITATRKTAEKDENALLKQQLAEQQKQMESLMAQMEAMTKIFANSNNTPVENTKRNITFISMVKGGLTLKGTRFYHIEKQFGKRIFPETEARIILNNMPETVQNGLVYITDRHFIEENELSEYYDHLVDEKTMRTLLEQAPSKVMEIYKEANNEQKKIILDMVVDKCLNGEPIDANIVTQLGEACGVDFRSIEPEE